MVMCERCPARLRLSPGAAVDLDVHVELGGGPLDDVAQLLPVARGRDQDAEDEPSPQHDLLDVEDLDPGRGEGCEHRRGDARPVLAREGDQQCLRLVVQLVAHGATRLARPAALARPTSAQRARRLRPGEGAGSRDAPALGCRRRRSVGDTAAPAGGPDGLHDGGPHVLLEVRRLLGSRPALGVLVLRAVHLRRRPRRQLHRHRAGHATSTTTRRLVSTLSGLALFLPSLAVGSTPPARHRSQRLVDPRSVIVPMIGWIILLSSGSASTPGPTTSTAPTRRPAGAGPGGGYPPPPQPPYGSPYGG